MAHPHLSETLASFRARIHRTKNRLVAIPADVQRRIGLARRPDNHLVLISLRPAGKGYWNRHYVKLTFDNEFAIPADVTHLRPGDDVEVKIHRVVPDVSVEPPSNHASGAGLLLALAARHRSGWRTDGSERLDDYLNERST
jgi:hypothetical protein